MLRCSLRSHKKDSTMSKTYLKLTIEVQIDISHLDPEDSIQSLLTLPNTSPELKEIDGRISAQAMNGAYNVLTWRVQDYPEPFYAQINF